MMMLLEIEFRRPDCGRRSATLASRQKRLAYSDKIQATVRHFHLYYLDISRFKNGFVHGSRLVIPV